MPSGYDNKVLYKKSGSAVGTNAGVTVTLTGVAKQAWTPLGIQVSGDAAALITIESPAGTVLYRKRKAAAFDFSDRFDAGDLIGASGADLLVKISASTANCEAQIEAAAIPG
jgi:hypothetical protein